MNDIKILDCTLRDGGYINNWEFGNNTIKAIIKNLVNSNVDIIETGFIRNVTHDENSSVFSSIDQIKSVIEPKSSRVLYAAMVEQHNYDDRLISNYDGKSIDIIRLTFRKNEWNEAKKTIKDIMKKGYKVCVQPVGTASYDDQLLLDLLKEVNEIKPFAFYLVDTLGLMYRHDMRRLFYLIDNNLSKDILLGFHSHNNLQMSFANAQEMMRLSNNRKIILDSSCYGMGRGVGNLTTELIIDYINNNIEQKYSLAPILNIVDKYLMPIYAETRWGYDLPYFLSATVKCHPNYAAYLMKKQTLEIEKIEKILSLIPIDKRDEYDNCLIEKLYFEMQNYEIDDKNSYIELKKILENKDVVILGLGASIINYKSEIDKKLKDKIVISVNYLPDNYSVNAVFVSNEKRLDSIEINNCKTIIATSNLKTKIDEAIFFDYSSLLGEGNALDNAGAMLIKILKKLDVNKIYLAGFDGYDVDASMNFAISKLKTSIDYDTAKRKNKDISKQLKNALSEVDYEFITPTKYEISNF